MQRRGTRPLELKDNAAETHSVAGEALDGVESQMLEREQA